MRIDTRLAPFDLLRSHRVEADEDASLAAWPVLPSAADRSRPGRVRRRRRSAAEPDAYSDRHARPLPCVSNTPALTATRLSDGERDAAAFGNANVATPTSAPPTETSTPTATHDDHSDCHPDADDGGHADPDAHLRRSTA